MSFNPEIKSPPHIPEEKFSPLEESKSTFDELFSDDLPEGKEINRSDYDEGRINGDEVFSSMFSDDFEATESTGDYETTGLEPGDLYPKYQRIMEEEEYSSIEEMCNDLALNYDDVLVDESDLIEDDADADDLDKENEDEDSALNDDEEKAENENDVEEKTADTSEEYEYDEDGTRELMDEEKQELKDKLGWSDDKIDKKSRIDKDGVIHYKTDCQDKEGQTSDCGVPYERKRFEYKGVVIEGVFPKFDYVFETELSEEDYQKSSSKQFDECNKRLKEEVEKNPELKKQFTEEQLKDIEEGNTPEGYTWHHNEEPGKMQLVKTEDHDKRIGGAAHTGGNSIWGNKSTVKETDGGDKEGVTF